MPLPNPPSSLDGSCTVIHNNVLYSYTPTAFQALALDVGAKWETLAMGESVSGAACVGATAGDAAFWVVGGTGGPAGYTGLQKYSFADAKWTTVTPSVQVTHNRQWHGATYIKANNAIIVYAGSQDGVKAPSTQTFAITAAEPYSVLAFESRDTHAAVEPILLNWSDADACLIGGDTSSTVISLFNPAAGWRPSGASLAQPLPKDKHSMQAVVVLGDDNSKSLVTFDLTEAPNQVKRYVLQDASGAPVHQSAPVSKGKRALTLDDWPDYNSTMAPTSTRQNYAIAEGPGGLVVFSGGNAQEPIVIFDASGNKWVNATEMLSIQEQQLLTDSSTTSTASSTISTSTTLTSTSTTTSLTTSTSTSDLTTTTTTASRGSKTLSVASATSTSDAAAAAGAGNGNNSDMSSNTILGITLGSIFAFLVLLGLLLFLLRRRRAHKEHTEAGHARRDSGPAMDEKVPFAYANGANHPPPSPGYFRGHNHQMSNESYSSMAILMGRAGQKGGLTRKPSNDSQISASTLHKQQKLKQTIGKPVPQPRPEISQHPALQGHNNKGVAFDPMVAEPRPRNGHLEAQDGTRRSSGWNKYWSGGSALQILGFGGTKRTTTASDESSQYSESIHRNPRVTQDSATVPPLNFQGRPEVNAVNSGSPVVASHGTAIPFKDGMTGKIERTPSKASSGYSSGVPESVNEAWPPHEVTKPWGTDRAPSSAYNPSFYYAAPLSPSASGHQKRPSDPPLGVSRQPQLAMASTSSDMSWLNLGDQKRV